MLDSARRAAASRAAPCARRLRAAAILSSIATMSAGNSESPAACAGDVGADVGEERAGDVGDAGTLVVVGLLGVVGASWFSSSSLPSALPKKCSAYRPTVTCRRSRLTELGRTSDDDASSEDRSNPRPRGLWLVRIGTGSVGGSRTRSAASTSALNAVSMSAVRDSGSSTRSTSSAAFGRQSQRHMGQLVLLFSNQVRRQSS